MQRINYECSAFYVPFLCIMSKYVHICSQKIDLCQCPGSAKFFSKMSNLPYFIGESKLVVYATINVHIVASTIVAYATICPARPMPRVGSISRQAGRQKSVRSAKICPVGERNHDPLPMTVPMHSYAEPESDHYKLCEISVKLCAFVSNLPHFAIRQA